jgi:two-component system, NtrC family, response regulator AtoC
VSQPFWVLVVDDEDLYAQAIGREIGRQGISCDLACNCREALRLVANRQYGVILLDHRLPDDDGIRIIPQLLTQQPDAALIMMTAYQTIPNAVRAIRHGAEDYIVKEASLTPIIERVLELRQRAQLREEPQRTSEAKCHGFLGRSSAMQLVIHELSQVAAAKDTTLLLTGETGVGKEVACRFVHSLSRPAGSPLVVVDCLALPETLVESLLFGHERGAFTGAQELQTGAFEEARDGTVFLDEIGDMELGQGKLLRVLESRTFRRLGSSREIPLKARVVAATNQDLSALVQAGRFRQDLFQRLSVFPICIPPLRERGDDILLLAEHFRIHFSERMNKPTEPLGAEVSDALMGYTYPGNVRELKNIIERAVILTESSRLEPKHLPQRVFALGHKGSLPSAQTIEVSPGIDSLVDVEVRMIRQAMNRACNVRSEAAKLLGISRFQLLRRMRKFGMKTPSENISDKNS